MEAYRLSNVTVKTYDGRSIPVEVKGIYRHTRKAMEDFIIKAMREVMVNDIPVAATFKMINV